MASVLVPLAEGCEELEAVTVIDLLRRAEIEVVTASLGEQIIKASRGTLLIADTTLDEALNQTFDMIVLPGGLPGAEYLRKDPRIRNLLTTMAAQGRYTAAICAAPQVLADVGLLAGKRATGYPGGLGKYDLPDTEVDEAQAVISDGTVITSRGPGTAMDFALTLIETLEGKAKRDEVEAGLVRS